MVVRNLFYYEAVSSDSIDGVIDHENVIVNDKNKVVNVSFCLAVQIERTGYFRSGILKGLSF